jgi:hypothetical protein
VISLGHADAVWAARFRGYSAGMSMEGDSQHYVLFVTGPLRERLYRRFSWLFQGRDDVEVRLDRRVGERRHELLRPIGSERRAGDRRRRRPEWIVPPPDGV